MLHHQTEYKCPKISGCPYTGKTLLEKRYLLPLPNLSCNFDLCSRCAMKNDEIGRKNECSKGHQLSAVKAADFNQGWFCDECECEWSPEEELDQDVVVWRCQQDFRLSVGPYSEGSLYYSWL